MYTVGLRRITLVVASLSFVLGLSAFNPGISSGAPNSEIALSATNEQITLLYIDALNFYKEGKYEQASGAVAKIQGLLAGDLYTNNVRKSLQVQPTDRVIADLSAKFKQRQVELTEAKRLFAAGEYARAAGFFADLARESPQSAEIAKYVSSLAQLSAKEQAQAERQQQLSAEKARKDIMAAAQAQENARLKALQQLQREQKLAELARQKEEQRFAQENIARERLVQQQARAQEIAERKEAERAAQEQRMEEQARQKEELRLARERQMQERENARLALIQQKQGQEQQLLEERRGREERLRLKKEMEASRLAELKSRQDAALAQKRQELATRQEELNRQKEEFRSKQERTKQDEETARQARLQDIARQKEEQRLQQERLAQEREAAKFAQQQELTGQKEAEQKKMEEDRAQRQAALQAREDLVAQQRAESLAKLESEKQQRLVALEKDKQEQRAREEALRAQRQTQIQAAQLQRKQETARLAAENQRRDAELAARQEVLQAKAQEETRRKQQAQEELARKKQQQLDEMARKKQQQLAEAAQKKQDELARQQKQAQEKAAAQAPQKPEPAPAAAPAPTPVVAPAVPARLTRADAQEMMLSDVKTMKHQEDQAKIAKADRLWDDARRHYRQGAYTQSIVEFQEIIQIEGNPRIKYTPYAKEYIEKAKEKIDEQDSISLGKQIETIDSRMIEEVKKKQILPYIEPPEIFQKSTESPLIEPPPIRKLLKKKVSLDFEKVDLKTVVNFLSEESGVNIVVSQKVLDMQPKVNARFSEAQVDDSIKYITKSLGLVYRIDKDVVWIAHPEEIAQEALETRVYYLNKGGGLFTEFSPISSSSETGLGGSSAQINKVMTIEDTLKDVVPWPSDAKLTYDRRLNALIVRNTPQNLQMLEDMLFSLDVTPVQILIEARFLEVDVTDTKELGLTWDVNNASFQKKKGLLSHGLTNNSGVDFSTFTNAGQGLNLSYQGLLTNPQFQTVLHAMEENKKIKTLSSPRITTLNNQAATIKVVDEWIYPTRYEYEIVQFDLNGDGDFSDAGETTFKNVPKDFLRRDVGILLKVVPAVGADRKTISLSLIPEVSEATADGFVYTGDVKLPKFTSRNLSTTVVVNSGETVVLGGLIKENRTKTLTKVPVLADVPLLGAFFRKNTDIIERKNLIIFVTAKVLSPDGEEITVTDKK